MFLVYLELGKLGEVCILFILDCVSWKFEDQCDLIDESYVFLLSMTNHKVNLGCYICFFFIKWFLNLVVMYGLKSRTLS